MSLVSRDFVNQSNKSMVTRMFLTITNWIFIKDIIFIKVRYERFFIPQFFIDIQCN